MSKKVENFVCGDWRVGHILSDEEYWYEHIRGWKILPFTLMLVFAIFYDMYKTARGYEWNFLKRDYVKKEN